MAGLFGKIAVGLGIGTALAGSPSLYAEQTQQVVEEDKKYTDTNHIPDQTEFNGIMYRAVENGSYFVSADMQTSSPQYTIDAVKHWNFTEKQQLEIVQQCAGWEIDQALIQNPNVKKSALEYLAQKEIKAGVWDVNKEKVAETNKMAKAKLKEIEKAEIHNRPSIKADLERIQGGKTNNTPTPTLNDQQFAETFKINADYNSSNISMRLYDKNFNPILANSKTLDVVRTYKLTQEQQEWIFNNSVLSEVDKALLSNPHTSRSTLGMYANAPNGTLMGQKGFSKEEASSIRTMAYNVLNAYTL